MRPRLLVLNQYYRPGVEATANLLAQLCESLAVDHDVTVITGRLRQFRDLPSEELLDGVRVLRTRSTALDRTKLPLRAANYVSYLADSLRLALRQPRPDAVLCLTDPPMIGDIALLAARRHGAPLLVVSEDVFPEIAVALGRLDNPLLIGFLDRLVRFYLQRADGIVAIGETMRERLIDKGARPERIRVIPNWVDTSEIAPTDGTAWACEHGLDGAFVVMHSGNIGHAQDLDTLVHAAALLADLDDVRVVIVGFGARHAEISRLVEGLGLDNVVFLPYQERARLPESLSAAAVHVVGLAPNLAGYVVPSRIYGIMAAGRPVVVHADPASETAALVDGAGAGSVVPPGRPDLLADAIRDLHARRDELDEIGARGRAWVALEADRPAAVARYRALLQELREPDRPRRVLRVIARLNVGGPTLHVCYLTRDLDERGYETTLAAGRVEGGEAEMEYIARELGVEVLPIDGLRREIAPRDDIRALINLVRLIRRLRPDIIHTHTAKAGAIGRVATSLARVRPRPLVVHTFHGHVLTGYFSPTMSWCYRTIERVLARGSDALVAVSPEVRDDLVRLGVARAQRFAVVRLGLDLVQRAGATPASRSVTRLELGLHDDTTAVVWLGRMTAVKNLPLLLDAFARARSSGADLTLVLVGDGPDRGDLERLALELGIGGQVRFLGFRRDVAELYAAADVVALSSINEGTPVTLIEALGAGKAVVSTDVGGARDVLAAGRVGILVPPGDADAFAEALVSLADPAERARLGDEGRRHVTERYGVGRLVDDVDRLYHSLVAGQDRL